MRSKVTARVAVCALGICIVWSSYASARAFGPPAVLNGRAGVDLGSDRQPEIATDGAGNWVAVWEYATRSGQESEVLFSRSTDDGKSWSDASPLHVDTAGIATRGSQPRLVANGAGIWLAAWRSSHGPDGARSDLDILTSRSTDGGATWSAPTFLNRNAETDLGSDTSVSLAADDSGNVVAIWIAIEEYGDDPDVVVARSTDGGLTWSPPAMIDAAATTDDLREAWPSIATDGAGTWIAVWTSSWNSPHPSEVHLARSLDNGATWTEPTRISREGARVELWPQVVAGAGGVWLASWSSADSLDGLIGTDHDILLARSTDGGETWTEPAPVSDLAAGDSVDDFKVRVATDGTGRWVAVWYTFTSRGEITGTYRDVYVATSLDDGASWNSSMPLNPNATPAAGDDLQPTIATDEAGAWIAVWASTEDPDGSLGTDVDLLFARVPGLCPRSPSDGCTVGFDRRSLLIKEDRAGKERVVAKFGRGPAMEQLDFGDPRGTDGSAFGLCVYDDVGSLVASLVVDRAGARCVGGAPCWRVAGKEPPNGRGYIYEDRDASSDGVSKIRVRARKAGKSQALLRARNDSSRGRSALPTGIAAAVASSARVTVQLQTSDAECLSVDLESVHNPREGVVRAE